MSVLVLGIATLSLLLLLLLVVVVVVMAGFWPPLLGTAAAGKARRLLGWGGGAWLCFWSVVGLRKRRGWDFKAVSRSCKASCRWSERIEGEQRRRFLMLLASSFRAFETSAARQMQGSLNRARTAFGVYKDK